MSVCPVRVCRSLPDPTSQILTVLSQLPEARLLPSGLNDTDSTPSACPARVIRSFPAATSHSLIVWSPPPEARVLPSGLNAMVATAFFPFPGSAARSVPVSGSQSLIVPSNSPLADARVLPSGLYATEFTQSVCPFKTALKLGWSSGGGELLSLRQPRPVTAKRRIPMASRRGAL